MKRIALALILLTSLTACATVPSDSSTIAGPYECDGADTTFTIPSTLGLSDDDDLDVILITEATGAETVLTKTSHYTIAGANTNDPQDLSVGGTVTTTSAYSSAYQILLRRNTVKTQVANIDDEEVEEALDKLTWIAQDIYEVLGRCLKIQPSESGDTVQFAPEGTAGYAYRGATGNWSLATPSTGTQAVAAPWDSVIAGTADANEAKDARDDIDAERMATHNVMNYGATGDGVTDDTAAIHAAETAAGANGHVYFPNGQYILTDSLLGTCRRYSGELRRATVLIQTTAATPIFVDDTGCEDKWFEHFAVRATADGVYGFSCSDPTKYWSFCTWRDVEFYKDLERGISANLIFHRIENCLAGYRGSIRNGTWTALYIRGSQSGGKASNLGLVSSTDFFGQADEANSANALVDIQENACTWLFQSCDFENTETRCLYLKGLYNVTFDNCWFEPRTNGGLGLTDHFVYIGKDGTAGTRPVTFRNCWLYLVTSTDCDHIVNAGSASAGTSFHACMGNLGGGYYTKSSSGYDKGISALIANDCLGYGGDLDQRGYLSSLEVYGDLKVGEGISVSNRATSAGYVNFQEDSDDGDNYLTFIAQAMDANETMYPVYTRTIDVNNIEIKALATPIELVPAPGVGRLVVVEDVSMFLDYSGGALAEPSAPDDLAVEYDDGTGAQIVTWDSTGFITATADAISVIQPGSVGAGAGTVTSAANVNKNVVLINTGGNYTGAGSTSVIRVIVQYRILENLGL